MAFFFLIEFQTTGKRFGDTLRGTSPSPGESGNLQQVPLKHQKRGCWSVVTPKLTVRT